MCNRWFRQYDLAAALPHTVSTVPLKLPQRLAESDGGLRRFRSGCWTATMRRKAAVHVAAHVSPDAAWPQRISPAISPRHRPVLPADRSVLSPIYPVWTAPHFASPPISSVGDFAVS